MTAWNHRLGLLVLTLSLTACDKEDQQCVADCDVGSTGDSDTSDPPPGSETGDPSSAECAAAQADAEAFIENNRACETMFDCAFAEGFCTPGSACGTVGLAASADLDAWQPLHDAIQDTCGCEGAPSCGPALICNVDGQCEAGFGDIEAYCESYERDTQTWLDAHRSCETAADCQSLASTCYVDDCESVVVNLDADPTEWEQLDRALAECDLEEPGSLCNYVGECGYEIGCSDEGQCVAIR